MRDNYDALHEGFLTDMLSSMTDPDNFDFLNNIANRILNRNNDPMSFAVSNNIAKAASGLTAVFPVIVTEATSLEVASMISKAIERKAVALLQMLFAANQITNATGAQDYLKRFYSNLSGSMDLSDLNVDDVIDFTNKGIQDSDIQHESYVDQTQYGVMIKEAIEQTNKAVAESMRHYIDTGINKASINDFVVSLTEDSWGGNSKRTTKTTDKYRYKYKGSNDPADKEKYPVGDPASYDFDPDKSEHNINTDVERSGVTTTNIKDMYEYLNKQVMRSDIQKANEAVPSLMIVNFVSMVDNQKVVNTAVIGVKAMLHYVPSESMVNRVILKTSDNRGLFNFIRATTGEIGFFRDFLFAVDRAKIDAVSKSGKGSASKLWKLLELRAHRAKMYKASGKKASDASAITTLVISKAEVDLIRKYHRIDLSRPGTLMSIMRGYNLMASVVVDEVTERVDFLFDDGTSKFDTMTFASLEREDGNGTYKKVINLMTKGR